MAEITYRTMTTADIDAGLRLCRAVRWNQLRRDWEMFLLRSPQGCRVACSNEEVIGTSATIRYDDHFSWVGMVLVDPSERGRGTGTKLLLQALDILKQEESVRLDATPAGERIYRNFEFREEYWLSRMQATVTPATATAIPVVGAVRPATAADLDEIARFDAEVFGADRRFLLHWLLEGAPAYGRVYVEGSDVRGYLFGRHGFNYEHLGPLVARSAEVAAGLLSACLRDLPGKSVILDAPRSSTGWLERLESFGFAEQRPFIRMYKGSLNFPGTPDRQYAILGPEFG